jgi:hypothetical protein
MKIPFSCPSCAATGSVDAAAAGRSARCKHCGHRFTIPAPGTVAAEPEVFALEERPEERAGAGYAVMSPAPVSAFVPRRGDETTDAAPRRPKGSAAPSAKLGAGRHASRTARRKRLAWAGGAAAIALAAIALLAPNGVLIAACALMALGCVLIVVGYAVGAYGAFSEDFLYGFLYLVIPLYSAYYMVTRWDDLWVWCACMTLGVGLVLVGIEMARWGGVVV